MKLHKVNPGGLIALTGLLAAAAVPLMTKNPYYMQKFMTTGILIIATQGLNMMAGYAGQVSLGHAGLFAVGAYTAAKLALALNWGFIGGFVAAIVLTVATGLLLGIPALRVRHHYLAIVTIGFGIVVEKLAHEGGTFTGGFAGLSGIPGIRLFGQELNSVWTYYVILAIAVMTTWSLYNLSRTRTGLAFMAIREGELAAESLGISEYRYKLLAFVMGGLGGGMAGALYAHVYKYVSPESFTFHVSVEMLVMVLLGGMGTISGPIIGVLVLQGLPELISDLDQYRLIIYGLMLLGIILLLPGGIVSLIPQRWFEHARRQPSPDRLRELEQQVVEMLRQSAGGATAVHSNGSRPDVGPVLEVSGLTKRFGGVYALNDVSMRVMGGTIHALIGPNGSGKTTLLHNISGIYKPNAGSVKLMGIDVTGKRPYELAEMGLTRTFQRSQTFPKLTALDNVMIGQHTWRKLRFLEGGLALPIARREYEDSRDVAYGLLSLTGLADRAHQTAGSLPAGLQRLLEIARALAARPKVILLDEPAAGLTESEVEALDAMLRRIKELGITILLIEHDMRLVMGISDAVTVLDSGQVIYSGTPVLAQSNPAVIAAYLGDAAD